MNDPFFSICIPSYERVAYLERLLESIRIQSFRDFDVIVSDDSRSDAVEKLIDRYKNDFTIHYYRNETAFGTPLNWNNAISKASGIWVKLMHDDDWFSGPDSLEEFALATKSGVDFIWSAHTAIYDSGRVVEPETRAEDLKENPYRLFSSNVIGPPSCVLVPREKALEYDGKLKWLVDIDYYINQIRENGSYAINKRLVNIGFNETQVTNSCFLNRQIEIPEALRLYEKFGDNLNATMNLYNAWWRLMRNLEIRTISEVEVHKGGYEVPEFLIQIVDRQKWIPLKVLQVGPVSRVLMAVSFMMSRKGAKGR